MEDMTDMMPVPIREFFSGVAIPTDAFIKIGDEKFVMVAKQGSKIDKDQLGKYQDKEVTFLWVRKRDYSFLSHQTISLAGIIVKKNDLPTQQKVPVVSAAAQTVFRHMDHMGFNEETYHKSKQVTEATLAMAESLSSLSDLIESLNSVTDDLLRHSVAVSTMAAMIGNALQWQNKVTIEKLALGGLLHDIGKKALPPELLQKPKADMSYEEMVLYESHCFKGMEMVSSLGVVPDDVVAIIYQHHENAIGQGYPQKIRDVKMHPLARIVALANQFVDLTIKNVNNPNPKSAVEAINFMEKTMGAPFNKDAFKALKMVIAHSIKQNVA